MVEALPNRIVEENHNFTVYFFVLYVRRKSRLVLLSITFTRIHHGGKTPNRLLDMLLAWIEPTPCQTLTSSNPSPPIFPT